MFRNPSSLFLAAGLFSAAAFLCFAVGAAEAPGGKAAQPKAGGGAAAKGAPAPANGEAPKAESPPAEKKSGKAGKAHITGKDEGGKAAKDGEAESGEPPPLRPLAEIEKDLKKAHNSKDWAQVGQLCEEAALRKDPAAFKAIVTWGLQGEDRDLELRIFRLLGRIEDPSLAGVIHQEALKSPNFKTRIILLGVIAQRHQKQKDPASVAILAQALRDPSKPVVLTAIKWLRESRDAVQAVPPLIEALKIFERSSLSRVYFDILNALRDLTGVENLTDSRDWKNYWEIRKAGGPPKARKSLTQVVQRPNFFSVAIESDKILFIIDVSGSMVKKDPPLPEDGKKEPAVPGKTVVRPPTKAMPGGKKKLSDEERDALPMDRQRIFRVKKELVKLIEGLPQSTLFTVMSFNHQIHYIGDAPRLWTATPENKKKAQDWVTSMKAEGETWTDTAFEKAFGELKDVDTVYFLSDGEPFRNGKEIPDNQVLEGIKSMNRFVKCRVHTFGFIQAGVNLRRFLQSLAAQNDGKYTGLR